ncbi:hypothetical protein ACF1AE_18970 [Streptomyces sp. NPDC014986]
MSDAPPGPLPVIGEEIVDEVAGMDGVARVSPAEYSQDGAHPA